MGNYQPVSPEEMVKWEQEMLGKAAFLLAAQSEPPLQDTQVLRLIATVRGRDAILLETLNEQPIQIVQAGELDVMDLGPALLAYQRGEVSFGKIQEYIRLWALGKDFPMKRQEDV